MIDDATNEPSNTCSECGKECIGWVDDPELDYVCDDCLKLCLMCGIGLDDSDHLDARSCKRCE